MSRWIAHRHWSAAEKHWLWECRNPPTCRQWIARLRAAGERKTYFTDRGGRARWGYRPRPTFAPYARPVGQYTTLGYLKFRTWSERVAKLLPLLLLLSLSGCGWFSDSIFWPVVLEPVFGEMRTGDVQEVER